MPDYPTNVPAAGWYTDPSDPGQERWWGGVEWTHDVRPLAAPVPAPQPMLANVPGGGINPFAAIDAQEAGLGGGIYGDVYSAPASDLYSSLDSGSFSAPQSGFGMTAPQNSFAVNSSWYDTSRRSEPIVDPTNHQATIGLVLSLIGFSLFGIILSVIGLRKAREFEQDGDLPVGRKRSRWGLGLGIASFIIGMALLAAYLFAFQFLMTLYQEQFGQPQTFQSEQLTLTEDDSFAPADDDSSDTAEPVVVYGADGKPYPYDRYAFEQGLIEGFTNSAGSPPESLVCPDSIDAVVGATFTCTFSYEGVAHVMDATFTDATGTMSIALDGVVQP